MGVMQQWRRWSDSYCRLPTSKKVILLLFLVWLVQALPKWGFALLADGERAALVMRMFIVPAAG